MTSNIIYAKMDIRISSGKTIFSDTISLEQGVCLGVHFVPIQVGNIPHSVDISINNAQGGVLLNPTDYRDYIHQQGGYFAGMKQVNFPTNNNRFLVNVSSQQALNDDFVGQLIFTIQREPIKSGCGCGCNQSK